jgi:hypothetical protein
MSMSLPSIAAQIGETDPASAGRLGYYPPALVALTLPHKDPGHGVYAYQRENGAETLHVVSPLGVPFGTIPRLLISWVTTEAFLTRSPELNLGRSITDFSERRLLLGRGRDTLARLKNQLTRLFTSQISVVGDSARRTRFRNVQLAEDGDIFWKPQNHETGWESKLLLGQKFFRATLDGPYPIDLRIVHALQRSPFAIDIYIWLPWRLWQLESRIAIPWPKLALQFGAKYSRWQDFREAFRAELHKVLGFYRHANVEYKDDALVLWPSRPHIPPQRSACT